MKNFHIGQEVVYIKRTVPGTGLVKNKIYTIEGLALCGCSQNVDIGMKHNYTSCQCPECCETICYDQRWFIHEEAFEPIISSKAIESIMNEIPELA